MNKNTKMIFVNKDKESGESFIHLSDFSDLIDISLVDSYQVEQKSIDRLLDEPILHVTFFDKNGNIILPKEKN